MSVTSGFGGYVSQNGTIAVNSTKKWSVSRKSDNKKYRTSNSSSMASHVPGNRDWTGSYEFSGKELPAMVGDAFASFFLYNGERLSGAIVVDSVDLDCDVEAGGILSGKVGFGGNGALTLAAGAAPTDATLPAVFSSVGCKVEWNPRTNTNDTLQASYAQLPDVRKWSLSLRAENKAYNSDATGGDTKRVVGGLMASASVDFYQASGAYLSAATTRLTPGTYGGLKLYVNASTCFTLLHCVTDGDDTANDHEEGTLHSHQVGFNFSGFIPLGASLTQTRGSITSPAGTVLWS